MKEQEELRKQQLADEEEAAKAREEAEKKRIAQQKKNQEDELKREQILQNQRLDLINGTLSSIQGILGENNKASKAFAIAQATMNTYLGISEVWKSKSETGLVGAGFVQKLATSALTGLQGFAAVRNIAKTNPTPSAGAAPSVSTGGGGGGGSALAAQASAIAQAPQFNVVGTSGTSQLAESLAEQQSEPVRAYVVSTDVTTQQQLDRNKVETSTFG